MAFAKGRFYWGGKQSDGASIKEHIETTKTNCFATTVITDQTFSDAPPEVDCPVEIAYIWDWFIELDPTREIGMSVGSIDHPKIESWARLKRIRLLPIEVEALRQIDVAFIAHHNTEVKRKNG